MENDKNLLNSYILTKLGYKKIDDILNEKSISMEKENISQRINLNLCNKHGELEKVKYINNNGKMKVLLIKTETGIDLEAPINHIFYVLNKHGYFICKKAEELKDGDILISRNGDNFANEKPLITMNDAYLIGNLYSICFLELIKNTTGEYIEINLENENIKNLLAENLSEYLDISDIDENLYISNDYSKIKDFVNRYNINERISKLIVNSNIQTQRSFLKGFFDINSIIDNDSIKKEITNDSLIMEIQLMLKNMGIISKKKDNELIIKGREIIDFYNYIGFNNIDYEEAVLNINLNKSDFYIIPNIKELIESYYHSVENKTKRYDLRKFEYTRENILELLKMNGNEHLKNLILIVINENICYDKIVKIEKTDKKHVFDFDMIDTNTYIINSFITHNTL